MLTSKERANLRSVANKLNTEVIIGLGGITENVLMQINTGLDSHELVKIGVLQNSDVDCKSVISELAKLLDAEPVQCIGRKMVLYRYSRKAKKHIEF